MSIEELKRDFQLGWTLKLRELKRGNGMGWNRHLKVIIFVLFFIFFSSPLLAVNCQAPFYDITNTNCSNECVSPATCEIDDGEAQRCCFDLTAVPELPSWFGPFFLATLVAGYEYWRVKRRKEAAIKLIRKS